MCYKIIPKMIKKVRNHFFEYKWVNLHSNGSFFPNSTSYRINVVAVILPPHLLVFGVGILFFIVSVHLKRAITVGI